MDTLEWGMKDLDDFEFDLDLQDNNNINQPHQSHLFFNENATSITAFDPLLSALQPQYQGHNSQTITSNTNTNNDNQSWFSLPIPNLTGSPGSGFTATLLKEPDPEPTSTDNTSNNNNNNNNNIRNSKGQQQAFFFGVTSASPLQIKEEDNQYSDNPAFLHSLPDSYLLPNQGNRQYFDRSGMHSQYEEEPPLKRKHPSSSISDNNRSASFIPQSYDQYSFNPPVPPKQESQRIFRAKSKEALPRSEMADVDLVIDGEPPAEVRTRTPSELRTFSVSARVVGNYKKLGATLVNISLWYASNDTSTSEPVGKDILGGTKTVPILDGIALFDNLAISESSTKHKEREFCLQFILLRNDGQEMVYKYSRPFYAYSHKKVLQRRGSVKLRTLSKSWGKLIGGDQMHVIGSPFIQGPALSLIVRTPHGVVHAKPVEFYSDSVLFFELPPYPLPESLMNQINPNMEFKAEIVVTNDGRTYSNPMEFTYIADNNSLRSRI